METLKDVLRSFANPLYILWPPLLLLVSVPLAIFAAVTTAMAVALLAARVCIVYFELGVVLVHAYLFPPSTNPTPKQPSPPPSSPQRARRRGSLASTGSSQEMAAPQAARRMHYKSGSFTSLIGTSGVTRDFEGVGGWRLPGSENEEALWMGINSRLELGPAVRPRRHQRSLTSGSQRWNRAPEAIRISPIQSRSRTPVQSVEGHADGYFPPMVRPLSTASNSPTKERDARRKSSSSPSSAGSSGRVSMATKLPGE